MELRHLRYFLKAADLLSFTRAADALRITQSTLSHQIKQLEIVTGPLFDRAGRGVVLTPRGKAFMIHAERILSDVRTSVTALAELDNLVSGQLAIGVYRCFETSPLPSVLTAFSRKHPNVKLRVHVGNHADLTTRLIDRSLDLVIAHGPIGSKKRILAETIYTEPLVLMVGSQHPLFGCPQIRLDKLRDQLLISLNLENRQRRFIQRSLTANGIVPRMMIEMNSNEAVLAMVKCSTYVTICPAVNDPGLHSVRLPGISLKRSTVMLWRRGSHRPAAAMAMAPMIKSAYSARRSNS